VALYIPGDDHGVQLGQFPDAASIAPSEKLLDSPNVGCSGIFVADVGREKLHEAPGGALAGTLNQRRKRIEAGTGELATWNWDNGEGQTG
jgi:hypothetical protein